MDEWDRISRLLPYVGVPGAMALVMVYALTKGWIVPGWLYQEEKERAEKWEHRALEGVRLAGDAIKVADNSFTAVHKAPKK